jgi:acyl-CoA reductase-like NAD-dependent aldehyde dehydrogenase
MSQTTISPHNQQPFLQRTYPTVHDLDATIGRAAAAQKAWTAVPLADRIATGHKFIEEFKKMSDEVPMELTMQMGRSVDPLCYIHVLTFGSPIAQNAGEIRGFLDRAAYMLSIASASLADVSLEDTDKPGFRRFIKRTPLGVVLVIAPWK